MKNMKSNLMTKRPIKGLVGILLCATAICCYACYTKDTGACVCDGQQIPMLVPQGLPCAGQVVTVTVVGDGFGDIVKPVDPPGGGQVDVAPGGKCFFGWNWGRV